MEGSKKYKIRIIIDEKVHFGKPCVAGTRIPVEDVLELVQENITFDKIIEEYYPDLDIEDIKACVQYATDLVRSEEIHAEAVQMRFLTDHDVYQITVNALIKWGHDVITARQLGMQRSSDRDLLKKANETDRLFVTRDKDFGSLVFLEKQLTKGVILLRMNPKTIDSVHSQLNRLFSECPEDELKQVFCVIEMNRYRIRRL